MERSADHQDHSCKHPSRIQHRAMDLRVRIMVFPWIHLSSLFPLTSLSSRVQHRCQQTKQCPTSKPWSANMGPILMTADLSRSTPQIYSQPLQRVCSMLIIFTWRHFWRRFHGWRTRCVFQLILRVFMWLVLVCVLIWEGDVMVKRCRFILSPSFLVSERRTQIRIPIIHMSP